MKKKIIKFFFEDDMETYEYYKENIFIFIVLFLFALISIILINL